MTWTETNKVNLDLWLITFDSSLTIDQISSMKSLIVINETLWSPSIKLRIDKCSNVASETHDNKVLSKLPLCQVWSVPSVPKSQEPKCAKCGEKDHLATDYSSSLSWWEETRRNAVVQTLRIDGRPMTNPAFTRPSVSFIEAVRISSARTLRARSATSTTISWSSSSNSKQWTLG